MESNLKVENVTKYYKKFKAVDNANLTVEQGEFFTILGPSGSGKTTLLKLIAGFEEISSGTIMLRNENISSKKPYERNIGMVFQNYALFPHMTVAENIAYPLKRRKVKKQEVKQKVEEVLKIVHLEQYANHYPNQMSGGQQQRVALARAIVFSPPLLLLDEPLSALDKNLRQRMQIEIKSIQENLGITTISVTHDQEEALTMSDRICVMNNGGIEQIDTPENLYKYPKNRFVAEFIGEINLLKAVLIKEESGYANFQLSNGQVVINQTRGQTLDTKSYLIALRPENIQLAEAGKDLKNKLQAKVESVIYVGEALIVLARTKEGEELKIKVPSLLSHAILPGEELAIGWNPQDATILKDESAAAESALLQVASSSN
ncbi:ABC transporter ATP-binding protein [Siminovitchia acidinfaciens]|uniref:Spermidine/putrescine import ATP-binding protein PotA n=1 Tax=Siminovitchia acidinfaciens TaxID=2321395 RepID=A0A429Y7C1_9BACI|nr:ABC transporter ATP-binding protein [Siminovitchia acidinfaciens]RST77292.1 ABC transporter ATP-binding protein [Siminovitchia acidinfaciens]